MGMYYYLFSESNNECLALGRKGVRQDSDFEGPICWINGKRYYLPPRLLTLLIDRFYSENGRDRVHLLEGGDLYDSGNYLGKDDECIQVGGDEDRSPPLSKYLPEVNDAAIKNEIIYEGIEVS